MRLRVLVALLVGIVLTCGLALSVGAQGDLRLVQASYRSETQLRLVASWGVQIVHYQGERLLALADDAQIVEMRASGMSVQVLDATARPGQYYLAYLTPGAKPETLLGVEAVFPYGPDVWVVAATPEQVDELAMRGLEIVKLPAARVLPRAQPLEGPPVRSAYNSDIQAMVDAVSPTLLTGHVCKLQDDDRQAYCNELGGRHSYATAKLDEAARYLSSQFSALGLNVSYDAFLYAGWPLTNVVAELPGVGPGSDRVYIVCAHYDSTSDDRNHVVAPGADDNASGAAAVLEAARVLSQYHFAHTLRFVHFSGEEQGLIGSSHYAAQAYARGDAIDGVINLDMIGYESVPPNDHIVELHAGTDPASIALADAVTANISAFGLALAPQVITTGATDRSDHASFWAFGYPAILCIEDFQDFSPYYHRMTDTLAHMRPALMVEFTKATVASVAELAAVVSTATPTPTHSSTPTGTATQTATPQGTATPAVTPHDIETTVILQQGNGGYEGAQDTYLYQYAASANYCRQNTLKVGWKQQYAALLRFDLGSIPAGAVVMQATLQVYAIGWGGADTTLGAFVVQCDADLCQATWNQARVGNAWGLPGCNHVTTDRRASPEDSVTTSGIKKWYSLNLTSAVQGWVDGSLANRGALLRASYSPTSLQFASAESATPGLRPRLVVTYRTAGPSATPTATDTATSQGTATPAPTFSPTPGGAETTITLQQGSGGYSGAADTYIFQYAAGANYCAQPVLKLGYKQQYAALLAFGVGSIPAAATVTQAMLQVWAVGWGGENVSLSAYRVLRDTEPCQATWTQARAGEPWGLPGCNDTFSDRGPHAESSVTTSGIAKWCGLDLTNLVQGWVNNSLANHGILLRAAKSTASFQFASAESSAAGLRPRLVVTYRR